MDSRVETARAEMNATPLVQIGAKYVIRTDDEFEDAGALLRDIKAALANIERKRVSFTAPLNESLRAINQEARNASAPFVDAEARIKTAIGTFQSERERIAKEAQARAEEAARKEREKIAARIAKAEANGRVEKASVLHERMAEVIAPVLVASAPKVQGVLTRSVWKFEVTDPALLPREFLLVDESKIRKIVNALQGDTNIPGVRVYAEKQVTARAS